MDAEYADGGKEMIDSGVAQQPSLQRERMMQKRRRRRKAAALRLQRREKRQQEQVFLRGFPMVH